MGQRTGDRCGDCEGYDQKGSHQHEKCRKILPFQRINFIKQDRQRNPVHDIPVQRFHIDVIDQGVRVLVDEVLPVRLLGDFRHDLIR
ncbi:hypothetical protein D3C74_248130 [compost metagenome]